MIPQKNFQKKQYPPINRNLKENQFQNKFNGLRIIPLGGNEEVGRNMTIFEYGQDIIILDMGLQFPEEDMPGIDFIIPNISYLKGKEKNIRAVVISHGHLDHIGAAPILLEKLGYPMVIGRPLTLAMIKHRLEDFQKDNSKLLKSSVIQDLNTVFNLGPFKIKFFQVEHSIMDAVGLILETPAATVIHPGDWTMEKDDQGRTEVSYSHLAKLPRPTVLMLESLGSTDVRESASTEEMQRNLKNLITSAPGRVIIGTFASQIERIGWIIQTAEVLGKKIALDGYSMKMNIEIAKQLGYIKAKPQTIIKIEEVDNYPDNKLVILATGAQGEGNAVLSRMINGQHRQVKIKRQDTVVLSSSIIPGNEASILKLKDGLYRQCDHIIHGGIMDIHVSGHANREDIATMLKEIKPDYFIPVYAYHYMLREAGKVAMGLGYKREKVLILDNGQVAAFDKTGGKATSEKVPSDYVFVDGSGIGDVSQLVLRDRQTMADDGMIVIIATVDRVTGKLKQNPDIISRGFIYMKENKELVEKIRTTAKNMFKNYQPGKVDSDVIMKNNLRQEIGKLLYKDIQREPMILPVIIEI